MSFVKAYNRFGGDDAVESGQVPPIYNVYDMAAEWWNVQCVENMISGKPQSEWKFDNYQLIQWLAYSEVRHKIEEKRTKEAQKK